MLVASQLQDNCWSFCHLFCTYEQTEGDRQALQTCSENLVSCPHRAKLGGKSHTFYQLWLTLGLDILMSKYKADFDVSGVGGSRGYIYLWVWLLTDMCWWMYLCAEARGWHWTSFLGGPPPSFFDIEVSLILKFIVGLGWPATKLQDSPVSTLPSSQSRGNKLLCVFYGSFYFVFVWHTLSCLSCLSRPWVLKGKTAPTILWHQTCPDN